MFNFLDYFRVEKVVRKDKFDNIETISALVDHCILDSGLVHWPKVNDKFKIHYVNSNRFILVAL